MIPSSRVVSYYVLMMAMHVPVVVPNLQPHTEGHGLGFIQLGRLRIGDSLDGFVVVDMAAGSAPMVLLHVPDTGPWERCKSPWPTAEEHQLWLEGHGAFMGRQMWTSGTGHVIPLVTTLSIPASVESTDGSALFALITSQSQYEARCMSNAYAVSPLFMLTLPMRLAYCSVYLTTTVVACSLMTMRPHQ